MTKKSAIGLVGMTVLSTSCVAAIMTPQFASLTIRKAGYDESKKSIIKLKESSKVLCLTSISWIPSSAGLPVKDWAPPVPITPDACAIGTVSTDYRFANVMQAVAMSKEYADRTEYSLQLFDVSRVGYTYGIQGKRYLKPGSLTITPVTDPNHGQGVSFTAFVCTQTRLPNPKVTAFIPFTGEPFSLPVIYTEHRLTIYQDNTITEEPCTQWSLFPQHYCYDHLGNMVKSNHPALTAWKYSTVNPCL